MRTLLLGAHDFIERWRRALMAAWPIGCLAIVVGSLVPALALPEASIALLPLDKLIHFGAYGLIAFLPQVAIERPGAAILSALSMIVLGGMVELAQGFVPGREASLGDVLVNAAGTCSGIAVGLTLRPRAA